MTVHENIYYYSARKYDTILHLIILFNHIHVSECIKSQTGDEYTEENTD